MTKIQDLDVLQTTGQVRPVPLTRAQLLEHVAQHFDRHANKLYKAPLQIEDMTMETLRAMSVEGNIFGEVEKALGTAGVPATATMGGVMDALGIDEDQAHKFACNCHSETMEGKLAAIRLRAIANEG